MFVFFVTVERQPRRAGFVIQLDQHGDLERRLGDLLLGQTERTATKTFAHSTRRHNATAFLPSGTHDRLPTFAIDRTKTNPAIHRNRIWIVTQQFQLLNRDGESQVVFYRRFHVDDSQDTAVSIDQRTTAVSLFDWDRQLNQFLSLHLADRRNDSIDKTVLQPQWIAKHKNSIALFGKRFGKLQCGKLFVIWDVHANQNQIRCPIGRLDRERPEFFSSRKFDRKLAAFVDDVVVRGNQIACNKKPSSDTQLATITTFHSDCRD